jgi:hypothetical protein
MTLYEYFNEILDGLPCPDEYDFHCHPSVMLRLRAAYQPPEIDTLFGQPAPLYGTIDILVRDGYPPGYWRIYKNGILLKDGRFTD